MKTREANRAQARQAHEEGISVGSVVGTVLVLASVGRHQKVGQRWADTVKDEVPEVFNSG